MEILKAAEIRGLEECAVESGTALSVLMENAGAAAADFIQEKTSVSGRAVAVLCGRGNNGGDGFVIARLLAKAGAAVTVVLTQGAPAAEPAKTAYNKMTKAITIVSLKKAAGAVDAAAVLVDAVFGFGFHGKLPAQLEPLAARVNDAKALRFAVDLPSGAVCDTGYVEGACFKADYTVTFTALKPACVVYPAAGFCGAVTVRPIGIKKEFLQMLPCDTHTAEPETLRPLFPRRDPEGHKGTYGKMLMVCGSIGMAGACILAARGALRGGVGLLNIAVPHALYPILAGAVPEAVFTLLDVNETLESTLHTALKTADACLVGCGLGTSPLAQRVVDTVLEKAACPVVLDADALNLLAKAPERLLTPKTPLVVTPHPGEMARLCGKPVFDIRADRMRTAAEFSAKYRVVTVLKGAGTVIAAPNGEVRVNTTGNAGMAKGGSGDALAGLLTALLATGMKPFEAAYGAACIHGAAGDRAAARLSMQAMLPGDLIAEIPSVFREIEQDA